MLWRVIAIDSSNCRNGVAPLCPRQLQPGGPHEIAAGDAVLAYFDAHAVRECCPKPHLIAPDEWAAQQLADLMTAYGLESEAR